MLKQNLSEKWRIAKAKASSYILSKPSVQRILIGDTGNRELVGAAVAVLVIIIILMVIVFIGSELEDAADITGDNVWHNVSNETGALGESAASILKVGVIDNQSLNADYRPYSP